MLIGCRTAAEISARENRTSVNPLHKTRRYVTRPRDEEGYAPGARKNPLYEALFGHTGSHTQEPIKLIMQLISDHLPYPATQQPAQPPRTRIPLAGLISRPGEAGSSNSASNLVENTSPRYRSHLKARRGPVSEPLCQSGPQGGAISLPPDDCHSVSHHHAGTPTLSSF